MGNLLWLIVILILVGAFYPQYPIAQGYTYHPSVMPSLLGLVVILIVLRVLGVI